MPDTSPRLVPGGPRWGHPLPPVAPGLCPYGENGPEGARACSLAEGHDGDDHDLSRTTEETDRA